jgi:hypothetical protein
MCLHPLKYICGSYPVYIFHESTFFFVHTCMYVVIKCAHTHAYAHVHIGFDINRVFWPMVILMLDLDLKDSGAHLELALWYLYMQLLRGRIGLDCVGCIFMIGPIYYQLFRRDVLSEIPKHGSFSIRFIQRWNFRSSSNSVPVSGISIGSVQPCNTGLFYDIVSVATTLSVLDFR